MGVLLNSPASFLPISLTSCVPKLFERIILSRLLFFLESSSILSPRQTAFCSGRSTLDLILFLSQSILMGLTNSRRGLGKSSLLLISLKTFDSIWHLDLYHKLIFILAGLSPCFARWAQSLLSNKRACMVYQNHKNRSLSSPSRCSARIRSWPCTFLSLHK